MLLTAFLLIVLDIFDENMIKGFLFLYPSLTYLPACRFAPRGRGGKEQYRFEPDHPHFYFVCCFDPMKPPSLSGGVGVTRAIKPVEQLALGIEKLPIGNEQYTFLSTCIGQENVGNRKYNQKPPPGLVGKACG